MFTEDIALKDIIEKAQKQYEMATTTKKVW